MYPSFTIIIVLASYFSLHTAPYVKKKTADPTDTPIPKVAHIPWPTHPDYTKIHTKIRVQAQLLLKAHTILLKEASSQSHPISIADYLTKLQDEVFLKLEQTLIPKIINQDLKFFSRENVHRDILEDPGYKTFKKLMTTILSVRKELFFHKHHKKLTNKYKVKELQASFSQLSLTHQSASQEHISLNLINTMSDLDIKE